jgi:hypothetical protein
VTALALAFFAPYPGIAGLVLALRARLTKTFKLGGRVSNSVIVMLQGEFFDIGNTNSVGFVRLVIDGRAQNPSDIVIGSYKPGAEETHGFNWISEPLAPGTHTATIEWRDNGQAPFYAGATSMTILHK